MDKLNRNQAALIGVVIAILVAALARWSSTNLGPPAPPPTPGQPGEYLFCFWNIENYFDDRVDGYKREPDMGYDEWFGTDKAAFKQKLENVTSVLTGLNEGRGPDILALAEVESSERAAEVFKDALNARLKDPALHYKSVLYKNPNDGRKIATIIITRLPVIADRTDTLGKRMRILKGDIEVNGHQLVVFATHWTSRLSDTDTEGGGRRGEYGDQLYGSFLGMYKTNPKVDLLVCGDFNDNPHDASVTEHLRGIGDLKKVRAGGEDPFLFNLMAQEMFQGKGTHSYRGKAFLFDQIVVSPGLVQEKKEGWSCDPASVTIITDPTTDSKGRPKRFGNKDDKGERGYSDHLPVTVRLSVAGN